MVCKPTNMQNMIIKKIEETHFNLDETFQQGTFTGLKIYTTNGNISIYSRLFNNVNNSYKHY
jgi:hypothetical protein